MPRKGEGNSAEMLRAGAPEVPSAVVIESSHPETMVEAVLKEAMAEARTLYEVFTTPAFWKKAAFAALGNTPEERLATIQRTVDAYMQGTLSWKDIQKSVAPGARDAFRLELDKARFQAAEAQRARHLEDLARVQERMEAERIAAQAAKPVKRVKRNRKAKNEEQTSEHIEAPLDNDGLNSELYGLERKAKILAEHPHLPVDYEHFRAQRDAFSQRIRGYQSAEAQPLKMRLEALSEQTKGEVELPKALPTLVPSEQEGIEEEPAPEKEFRTKLGRLERMLFEVSELLKDSHRDENRIRKLLNGASTALAAANLQYGHTLSKPLVDHAAMISRRIEVYRDRASIQPPQEEDYWSEVTVSNRAPTTPEPAPERTEIAPKPKRKRRSILNAPVPKKKFVTVEKIASEEEEVPESKLEFIPEHLIPKPKRRRKTSATPDVILEEIKPDLSTIVRAPEERLEQKAPTFGERFRHGLSYLWNRGEVRDSAQPEARESETYGAAAKTAAALLRTAVTYGGIRVSSELFSFMPSTLLTKRELGRLETSFLSPEPLTSPVEEPGYASIQDLSKRLAERDQASRYGTQEKKAQVLDHLAEEAILSEEKRVKADVETAKGMAVRLVEYVSSMARGLSETRGKASEFIGRAGEYILRMPRYEGLALVKRYEALREGLTEASGAERIQKLMVQGFEEATKSWKSERSQTRAYAGLKTLGRTLALAGFAYASSELWETMPTEDTMTADELHARIDDALGAMSAKDDVHVAKELAEHGASVETLGEHGVAENFAHTDIPVVTSAWERDTLLPDWEQMGLVKEGDGITQALVRVIEQNPVHFGYHGADDELQIDLFARTLSRKIAKNDGLLRTWLTDQAVGNLVVVPVEKADGWHAEFLDAQTHEELSGTALQAFTKAQPRR